MAVAANSKVKPRKVFVTCSTWALSPAECKMKTPANAMGIEPTHSHRTSSQRTVLRRMCTPPPMGFITIAATRSDDTAVVGLIPKKINRMGVMSAPPPMPVRPTVNPTNTEAKTMAQSMCMRAPACHDDRPARCSLRSNSIQLRRRRYRALPRGSIVRRS